MGYKLFKSPINEVFAYEDDGSQDHLIDSSLISITEAEADVLRAENLQAFISTLPYDQQRMNEYPDFRLYLDGIVKNDQSQIQAYISACQAVKAKYPKPQ